MEMDRINEQNSRTNVSALHGFAAHSGNGQLADAKADEGDTYVMDETRRMVRDYCSSGNVMRYIDEILSSGIEPDSLRAELAYRAALGDKAGCLIVINYLAGNFKEALEQINLLMENGQNEKLKEFLIFADYFAGRFDAGCASAKNLAALDYSPFLCYVYAEMLLSLGYVEQAREYNKKYVRLARKYIQNFVSEKEKYDEQKKRREQGSRRKNHEKKENAGQEGQIQSGEQNSENYDSFKELLSRRRIILTTLKIKNINLDKKPLLFELEDIDAKIAVLNGKNIAGGLR